jgi:hypothetical protein
MEEGSKMKPPKDTKRLRTVDRRAFSKMSLAALGGSLVASGCGKQNQAIQFSGSTFFTSYGETTAAEKTPQIQYIRGKIPEFEIPPYRGVQYEDTVPDTLDIAERAKLGINLLTSITDPNADYEVYWLVDFSRNPPVMIHDFNDWVMNGEGLMEALPLLRHATGSSLNDQVDPVWMKSLLQSIGPDGLIYLPLKGRPWSRISAPLNYVEPVWAPDGKKLSIGDSSITQIASPFTCQRMIGTMTLYYLRDQNPMWKSSIEQMIQHLSTFAVAREDYAYLPAGSVEPNSRYGSGEMPSGFMAEETSARLIQGLARYHRLSGYEPARELAGKLTRYVRYHARYYEADGPPLIGSDERTWWSRSYDIANVRQGGHGHAHGIGLVSILEYAAAVDDRETLAFVKSSYEWLKANGSSRVGFFPEVFAPKYDRCEADTIADMVAMALKLTIAGAGDHWGDADRWVRNHFSASQLTDPTWVHELGERSPRKAVAPNETSDRVAERNVGAFAGWSTGNDWVVATPNHPYSIQHCCSGNSGRTLYYVWQHILEFKEGSLYVNLLLNRASRWCDLHSYVPFEGKIVLKTKENCGRAFVRMPEWVTSGSRQVSCEINGHKLTATWSGRYIDVGNAKPGDKITLRFPLPESQVKETIGNVDYTLQIRGNTAISIDPRGRNGPLYERAYYRKPVTWKKVDRFVPEKTIMW